MFVDVSADVAPDTEFLSFVEMSTQKSFLMTVKVDGVARDGTTMFIHNKVHNRTRTLSCREVSIPQSVITHHATPSQTCFLK